PALLVIGVLWAARETFKSDIGPVWAGVLRLVVILACYMALIVPLTLLGIRRIARHMQYTLPPQPVLRTAAAFTLPATLGYVTWVALGSVSSLIVGVILGLCFGAGAFWLLFRLELKELGKSFAVAAGSFAGSLIACGVLLLLLNL